MYRTLEELRVAVAPVDRSLHVRASARLDNLTKPRGSLGRLEEIAARLFCIAAGVTPLCIDPAVMFTVAGDHGVAAQGVSLYPQIVTRQMVRNFLDGGAGINVLCGVAGVEQRVVDAGCAGGPFEAHPGLIDLRLGNGTADISEGPAMSMEVCRQALSAGARLAEQAAAAGRRCIGIGEMGIGNTTVATALSCALFNLAPEELTGAGTGLDQAGIERKVQVVRRALAANSGAVASGRPLNMLAALGGFEIAVMAGIALGAAARGLPVMVDGFISTAAAAVAVKLCPNAAGYCFFAHSSAEKGHAGLLRAFGAPRPLFDLDLRLGEGTGGALAVFLLRAAAAVYNDMASFKKAGVSGNLP